jgi:hypothetical protein
MLTEDGAWRDGVLKGALDAQATETDIRVVGVSLPRCYSPLDSGTRYDMSPCHSCHQVRL